MNIPLSDSDIKRLLGGRVRVVVYSQLSNFNSLENLFGPYDCVVLLYEKVPNNGHWTCLIKIPGGDVEFYDPYGGLPDSELQFMHYSKSLGCLLSRLLINYHQRTGHDIWYNHGRQQKLARDVNSCGRHCVLRILFRWIPIDQYINMMKDKDVDQIALNFTS